MLYLCLVVSVCSLCWGKWHALTSLLLNTLRGLSVHGKSLCKVYTVLCTCLGCPMLPVVMIPLMGPNLWTNGILGRLSSSHLLSTGGAIASNLAFRMSRLNSSIWQSMSTSVTGCVCVCTSVLFAHLFKVWLESVASNQNYMLHCKCLYHFQFLWSPHQSVSQF